MLGGMEQVALYLGVPEARLRVWLRGRLSPPDAVFLKLVDLLSDGPPPDRLSLRSDPKRRGIP